MRSDLHTMLADNARAPQWQPIETAPRDRPVLLGWPIRGRFPGKVCIGEFGGCDWPSHYGRRAKHWMPLPFLPDPPGDGQ